MTAMRAMQNNIESKLGALGSKTFAINECQGSILATARKA